MDEPVENKRQAVKPHEPACMVSVTFLYYAFGSGFFSLFGKWRMGWYAAGISVCGCDHPCSAAFAKTGTGFYVQGRTSYEYAF